MFRTAYLVILLLAGIVAAAAQTPPGQRTAGPPAVTYRVFLDGEQKGPFTLDELKAMAAEGRLHAGIHVWKVGLADWTLSGEVPELAAFVPAAPAPAPEPAPAVAYYVETGGEAKGPFTIDDLAAMAGRGEITGLSPIWKDGLAGWTTAAGIAEVAALLAPAADTTPPAGAGTTPEPGDELAQTPDGAGQPPVAETPPPATAEATPPPAAQPTPPPAAADETPPPVVAAPPAAAAPAETKYFVAVGERSTGPFTFEEMKAKVATDEVTPTTQIWKKGMEGWAAANTVTEIAALIGERPTAPPFDCTGYMIGLWEKSTMIAGNRVTMRIAYEANGLYSGVQSTAGPYGPLAVNFYGKWTATAVGEKTCSIESVVSFPTAGTSTGIFEVVDRHLATDKSDNGQWRRLQ